MKSGKYLTAGTCSGSRETYSQRHDTESRREGKNIKRRGETSDGYTKEKGDWTRGDRCRCIRVLNVTAQGNLRIRRGYKGTVGVSRERRSGDKEGGGCGKQRGTRVIK